MDKYLTPTNEEETLKQYIRERGRKLDHPISAKKVNGIFYITHSMAGMNWYQIAGKTYRAALIKIATFYGKDRSDVDFFQEKLKP